MSATGRLFMDVSYTRTQHGNVGITRTVRRLLSELEVLAGCTPVSFHHSGYRQLTSGRAYPRAPDAGADGRLVARLFRCVNADAVRRLVSLLPMAVLRNVWTLSNKLTFNALSADGKPVAFRHGDCLVLADESWNYPAWIAAQDARRQGAFVVLILHDLIPLRHPEFCAPLFADVFRRWLARMLGHSDAVVCNSRATEADLERFCLEQALPLPRTSHFRLGSDFPRERDGKVRQHLANFMAPDTPVFAAIGTIEPRKNHQLLLTAFEQLWRQGSQVRLVILGRPHPECRELIARLRRHPQQGRLLLVMLDASDTEVTQIYANCRALVFPSLAEGFGLPLVEARTRGCPVIASNLPALAELADSGVFLFRQNSVAELVTLIVAHMKHDRRAEVGQMPAFTWNDSASQLLHVVDGLLGTTWKM